MLKTEKLGTGVVFAPYVNHPSTAMATRAERTTSSSVLSLVNGINGMDSFMARAAETAFAKAMADRDFAAFGVLAGRRTPEGTWRVGGLPPRSVSPPLRVAGDPRQNIQPCRGRVSALGRRECRWLNHRHLA